MSATLQSANQSGNVGEGNDEASANYADAPKQSLVFANAKANAEEIGKAEAAAIPYMRIKALKEIVLSSGLSCKPPY